MKAGFALEVRIHVLGLLAETCHHALMEIHCGQLAAQSLVVRKHTATAARCHGHLTTTAVKTYDRKTNGSGMRKSSGMLRGRGIYGNIKTGTNISGNIRRKENELSRLGTGCKDVEVDAAAWLCASLPVVLLCVGAYS